MKRFALILICIFLLAGCSGETAVPLEEVTVDYWDVTIGIKEYKGNYIATTDNEVYYRKGTEWIKDEVLSNFEGNFEILSRDYFLANGAIYYHKAGEQDLASIVIATDLKLEKVFYDGYSVVWAMGVNGQFHAFANQEGGPFEEIVLPEQLLETGVKDFVGNIYITDAGEAREFVWTYDRANHINEQLYNAALITTDAKELFDAGEGKAVVLCNNGDLFPMANSKTIATIKEPILAVYGYSVIQTEKGYYYIENGQAIPAKALNAYKERVVSINAGFTPTMVLDDGKVYQVK